MDILQEVIDDYNLSKYVHDGWVYFKVTKGVYGLKEAGKMEMICWLSILMHIDTINASPPQACGNTNGGQ